MADALHPQTLVAYGMNGAELPVGNGGPLRLRVPRQLGYKNVKYITRLTVTDNLKRVWRGFRLGVAGSWLRLVRGNLTEINPRAMRLLAKSKLRGRPGSRPQPARKRLALKPK